MKTLVISAHGSSRNSRKKDLSVSMLENCFEVEIKESQLYILVKNQDSLVDSLDAERSSHQLLQNVQRILGAFEITFTDCSTGWEKEYQNYKYFHDHLQDLRQRAIVNDSLIALVRTDIYDKKFLSDVDTIYESLNMLHKLSVANGS